MYVNYSTFQSIGGIIVSAWRAFAKEDARDLRSCERFFGERPLGPNLTFTPEQEVRVKAVLVAKKDRATATANHWIVLDREGLISFWTRLKKENPHLDKEEHERLLDNNMAELKRMRSEALDDAELSSDCAHHDLYEVQRLANRFSLSGTLGSTVS